MKKMVLFVFMSVFMLAAGYRVYYSIKPNLLPELMLANVEALAMGEAGMDKEFIISYTRTISEEEGNGYKEIVWEDVVNCMSGGPEDCTPSRTTHVTRIYHSK